ncbi:restriction endonuclease subunit S [Stutzerimonas stutzeri]|uniref:restriction endonuclease subunit S n=1 Tax=Stutzerimonas stutzeri TaxID=316 RepID=UPI00210A8984|nr:restriction endonuclease subunit S [Stutzerimonas stutzeri]MCQ4237937.1 restriction endonuclease subunit S [Stutzerimonas stutzeri]
MSELPSGWGRAEIGDLCNLINGRAFKPQEWSESGLPIIRIQNLNNPASKFNHFSGEFDAKHHVKNGDLLFAWSGTPGTSFGAHIWHGGDAVLNQHIFKIEFSERETNRGFLRYAINQKLDELISSAQGGVGLRHVTKGTFEKTEISFPPLAEQTRIAQKLDELLAQVDTLKSRIDGIPTLLKRFRQSVLTSAVSGRLTEGWRDERQLPSICEVELGALIKSGPQNGLYKPSSAYGEGSKIIRIDSFYSGEIKAWDTLRSLKLEPKELDAWGVKTGDILINRVNSIEYLGKCALVRTVPEPTVFESNIMRMSLHTDRIHPEYLMRYLTSEVGRKALIVKAKHAVNQASINQGDVKACKVPLPSLEEQTEIVRRVEQFFAFADQLETKVTSAKNRIDHLTQSILAKAFRGELVPQYPNDEPASVLLERIKAQRTAAPKAKRGRKASA